MYLNFIRRRWGWSLFILALVCCAGVFYTLPRAEAELPSNGINAGAAPKATGSDDKLFEGWPKPLLALVISGDQWGYIEPCGCTGLANQKGGLARRHTFLKELTAKGWPLVPVDAGNQARRYGRQSEIKLQHTANGLRKMQYAAVGFGPDDLRLSSGELVAAVVGDDNAPSPFVSSNVDFGELFERKRVTSAGGKKIGITSVLGGSHHKRLQGGDFALEAPETALRKVAAELQAERCDLYVLLSYATEEESKTLAQKFPLFDIVVTTGVAGEPTREPERLNGGKTWLVQTGNKGMYVGVVGVFADAKEPLRYQRVPLDARFADSPEMMQLLKDYQKQLESVGFAGLELEPRAHATGRTFVGSAACADCHSTAYDIWKKTPHAHATDSLVTPGERSEIPRHFDPECLSCHVTGWNAQGFYPYLSGYLDLKKTPAMLQNGCENCHGPGSAHVAAENGEGKPNSATLAKLRAEMRLPLANAERVCLECHDLDNSPDFHVKGAFEKYWKQVEHKGKD